MGQRLRRFALAIATAALLASGDEQGKADQGVCEADSSSDDCRALVEEASTAPPSMKSPLKPPVVVTPTAARGSSRVEFAAPEEKAADLITQEVEELEGYIKLCEDRIAMLEELQAIIGSGIRISIPDVYMRAIREPLPMLSEVVKEDPELVPVGLPEDYLVAKASITQEEPVSFIHFVSFRSPSGSDSDLSPSSSTLVASIRPDGTVRLFTLFGELLLSFSTGHEQPVVLSALTAPNEEQILATADAGGCVRTHRFQMSARRLTADERKARRGTLGGEERVSQFFGAQVNVSMHFLRQLSVVTESGEIGLTAMTFASTPAARGYVVVGDDRGTVSIFNRNGTLKATVDVTMTPGYSVEALHTSGGSVVFRAGSEWGYVDIEKYDVRHLECAGVEGRFVAMHIDPDMPSRIYVVSEAGDLLVLSVRNRRDCKVDHTFHRGIVAEGANVSLLSIPGHLLSLQRHPGASPAVVSALNMSHIGKRRPKSASTPSAISWRMKRDAVRGWTMLKRHQQGELIMFLSEDGREIEIAELLMKTFTAPPQDSFLDSFGHLPFTAIGIVLVLGYQYMKMKKKNKGATHAKEDSTWDSAEFREKMEKLRAERKAKAKVEARAPA